ncbi:MAG: hypothetical protein ACE5JZ_03035 [Kiloniellales bacterium]
MFTHVFGFFKSAKKKYRYLRLDITASQSGTEHAVGELKIFEGATDHPTSAMTSNTAPSPLVASAKSEDGTRQAYQAFDDDIGTDKHWGSAPEAQSWVQINLGAGNGIAPTSYKITAGNSAKEQHAPKDWSLKGSNTGSFSGEEDTLHTKTGEATWAADQERTYTI